MKQVVKVTSEVISLLNMLSKLNKGKGLTKKEKKEIKKINGKMVG